MPQQLSEQAQQLIADFRRRLETLPAEERAQAAKEMAASITSINDDIKALFASLQESMNKKGSGENTGNNDIEHISDYM